MSRSPVLFVSHESPFLWDTQSPARDFLQTLGTTMEVPRAALVVSAHWQEEIFKVSAVGTPDTIHDFSGFPEKYRDVQYPAPGSPEVAEEAHALLVGHGVAAELDHNRGMDHAVWLPIGLMYPQAQVPVVSMSIKLRGSPEEHRQAGRALTALRDNGVLIIGSGTATHNLRAFFSGKAVDLDGPPDPQAAEFSDWLKQNATDPDQIVNYRRRAPHATICHPTPDHFMPFIVAMGAGAGDPVSCLHESFSYSHFAMTNFAWGWQAFK